MKALTLIATAGTIAALAVPAAQAATTRNALPAKHVKQASLVQQRKHKVTKVQPASAPVVSIPAVGIPTSNGTADGSFSDSYFDMSSIDTSQLSTTAPGPMFDGTAQDDSYLG